jgi:hypothetical protein
MLEGMDAFPLPKHRYGLTHSRAVVAEARGRHEEALALYQEAASAWAAFHLPYERGMALYGESRCLAELGRAAEAKERLAEARGAFAGLGAEPLVTEVDGWTP